jgi:hypothetical protein
MTNPILIQREPNSNSTTMVILHNDHTEASSALIRYGSFSDGNINIVASI